MTNSPRLQARSVSKSFGNTQALDRVDFEVREGEIHALLGENGAGKSTLVRMLSGVIPPDSGEIWASGELARLDSPGVALAKGIAVVHQELSLVPNLTVAANLLLSDMPRGATALGAALGTVDRRRMRRRATELLRDLDIDVPPGARVADLSAAQRQLVEIARALAGSARVLLLDEPTSSLPPDERQELFSRLRGLRDRGYGIVLITHMLEEALSIADRITVLRDGRGVGTAATTKLDIEALIHMMTGLPAGAVFPESPPSRANAGAKPVLHVDSLASGRAVRNVCLRVHAGEIVGLAGLSGSGRTETLMALFGARRVDGGTILLNDREVQFRSPRSAISHGLAYIPEDRQGEALFTSQSIALNIGIVAANSSDGDGPTSLGGWVISRRRMRRLAETMALRLHVKHGGLTDSVSSLSGGNQQKVILSRWLAMKPALILADDPTRGVSIGSKVEIYKILRDLAAQGTAIILVSSEFEELVHLCSRISVLANGRTTAEVSPAGLSAHELLNIVLTASSDAEVRPV